MQRSDTEPVDIQLIPSETVANRARTGVVVVVPAFAKGQERHPPVVGRIVARLKTAVAPRMRGRINQPGSMKRDGGSQEDAPTHQAGREERTLADYAPNDEDRRKPILSYSGKY